MTASDVVELPDVGSVNLVDPDVVRAHFEAQTEPVRAIPTPLPAWDRQCRDEGGGEGLALGWHVTIAGATGKGKSLLALNLGARAMFAGWSVGFDSFEMSRAQLATRLYAIGTNTPVRKLERGDDYSPEAARHVEERLAEVRRLGHFHTNEHHLQDIHEALELMRWWAEERHVRLFIIDYIQLAAPRGRNEYEAVTYVSSLIREFAVEHNVVTVGLCQLNRSTSANRAESPIVEGLKSTSALEQDSDQVVLLDHSRYDRTRTPDSDKARTFVLLGKNRHGGTGEIPVEWDYTTLRIREAKPDEEHLWPERGSR